MSAKTLTPQMSTSTFWLYTIGLLIVWVVVLGCGAPIDDNTTLSTNDTAISPRRSSIISGKELKNTANCKELCGHCGCMGFYCGEECICECNNEKSDTECIAVMQNNARKLNIPFELLIQGPSKNRFVRNALQFEQNTERKLTYNNAGIPREKRATVVVYKPPGQNTLINVDKNLESAEDNKSITVRRKRSVNNLEWFTDLANNLVRPAPLVSAKNAEEPPIETANQKRATAELDRSWFSDNTNGLIRPAPLFRRSSAAAAESPYDMPMTAIERLPHMVRDTLRNIQEGALVGDFAEAFSKMRPKDSSVDVYQNALPTADFGIQGSMRNGLDEIVNSLRSNIWSGYRLGSPAPPTVQPPEAPTFNIPWIRPVRFLKRVQEITKKD